MLMDVLHHHLKPALRRCSRFFSFGQYCFSRMQINEIPQLLCQERSYQLRIRICLLDFHNFPHDIQDFRLPGYFR